MARGWESKSVEAQVESAADKVEPHRAMTPEEITRHREKEALELSRARIRQQLQATEDPRYIKLLNDSLADLERKLKALK
jgi:hypothetical protein